jgi:hypothetical protein
VIEQEGMKQHFLILLFTLTMVVSGCAVGHVSPSGSIVGLAVGHAKLESTPACGTRIEGGALSSTLTELLSTVVAAAGAYFIGM